MKLEKILKIAGIDRKLIKESKYKKVLKESFETVGSVEAYENLIKEIRSDDSRRAILNLCLKRLLWSIDFDFSQWDDEDNEMFSMAAGVPDYPSLVKGINRKSTRSIIEGCFTILQLNSMEQAEWKSEAIRMMSDNRDQSSLEMAKIVVENYPYLQSPFWQGGYSY